MRSKRQIRPVVFASLVASANVFPGMADARVTRINAEPPVIIDLPAFGATGPYQKIVGTFEGEIDPADRRNAVIADIKLAPTTNGKVRYRSTFFLLRPVDLSKGNGKLFYDFGNRGSKRVFQWFNDGTASNDPTDAAHFGNGFLMRQGYIVALSGYMGDVVPRKNMMSVEIPVAVNSDGSPITGETVAEMVASAKGGTDFSLPYAASSTSPSNGNLTVREHGDGVGTPVTGWRYADERKIVLPGPVKAGWIYQFTYTARDPKVMGIGHAITRDFLSFLKHGATDDFGNANPVTISGGLRAIYSWGRSNGGRNQRDLLRWGFNEDEQGRIVIDGMMPFATGSGGHMWMNVRFSQPAASSRKHEWHFTYEPEFPHTFAVVTDPLTGQTDGLLRRCLATNTCPKVFNMDGANEYWNKSTSLNHTDATGKDLDVDAMAPNVRIYSMAAVEHNTTYDQVTELLDECQQMVNPLYNGPIFRALSVAMDRWVMEGTKPPASVVPKRSDGTLVSPEDIKYPAIAATAYQGWPALPAFVYSPKTMNRNAPLDFSAVPFRKLPGAEYTVLVPQIDKDGNEIAGIRLPELEAPLGTYTGWSILKEGAGFPDTCGQNGSYIPFAKTKAERLAAGDPRPSMEERYGDERAFAAKIEAAAASLVNKGFMLEEDKARTVQRATTHGFNLWRAPLPH